MRFIKEVVAMTRRVMRLGNWKKIIYAYCADLIVSLESNADMRITPGGVSSPDDSGGLHLI